MFNKKCKDPFADKVKCEKCKHWVDKSDAQEVKDKWFSLWNSEGPKKIYYCPEHKVPYDRIFNISFTRHYYKEFEVSAEGVPIGYKKFPPSHREA